MPEALAPAATGPTAGWGALVTLFGDGRAGEPIHFVLGFPSWVFWGIVAPWGGCVLIAGWFSWRFMSEEELGAVREDEDDA